MVAEEFIRGAGASEQDLADQLTPVAPIDEDENTVPEDPPAGPVNEADWLDQQTVVPLEDEGLAGESFTDE